MVPFLQASSDVSGFVPGHRKHPPALRLVGDRAAPAQIAISTRSVIVIWKVAFVFLLGSHSNRYLSTGRGTASFCLLPGSQRI